MIIRTNLGLTLTIEIFIGLFINICQPTSSHSFQKIFLPSVPYMVPLVHIALMGSVYSTIAMSLERYLRLCRVQIMSKKMFNGCAILCIVFPLVFYSPKFFEYRYGSWVKRVTRPVDCRNFFYEQQELAVLERTINYSKKVRFSFSFILKYFHEK